MQDMYLCKQVSSITLSFLFTFQFYQKALGKMFVLLTQNVAKKDDLEVMFEPFPEDQRAQ